MRFFHQSRENVMHLVKRCYFEADQSRIALALARTDELHAQFPDDPRVFYAEAILRRDHLGQGERARLLFQRSYTLAFDCGLQDDTCWSAACNAASLAANEREFRTWVELTANAPPAERRNRSTFDGHVRRLGRGEPYGNLLATAAEADWEGGHAGSSASHMEVLLSVGESDASQEAHLRRHRAQRLRTLDVAEERHRTSISEWFPPDERLALREAYAELGQALDVDPYDPELWNLRSAWDILLCAFENALQAADKASELRDPYPKCHINAANALFGLGRTSEARSRIEVAIEQARSLGESSDLDLAEDRARWFQQSPVGDLGDHLPGLEVVLRAARRCMDEDIGSLQIDDVVARLLSHRGATRAGSSLGYVPMLAELLSDFTPETVCGVIITAKQRAPHLFHDWLCSILFLIAKCDGVERRDAIRMLALLILVPLDTKGIIQNFRTLVMAPSAASENELGQIEAFVRDHFYRLNPDLAEAFKRQPPTTPSERMRAMKEIVDRLVGTPPPPNPNSLRSGNKLWTRLFG